MENESNIGDGAGTPPSAGEARKLENNLLRFHVDAAASAVEDAAVNYQAPSIIAAGASAQNVSILATLVNLCLSLVCVKAPALIEKLGLSKKGAVILSFINTLVWVPLILVFLFSGRGVMPMVLAMFWLVNIIPGVLLSFQRDNWLSSIVPKNTLGRYLGQRLAIKSFFYLTAFCVLGYLLDAFGGKSLVSFAFVFILALVMSTLDFITFTHMHEPAKPTKDPDPPQTRIGIFDFIKELKEKKLNTFVVFSSLFYLTVGLSGPLYAVYMLEEKHFSYFSFCIVVAAEFVARIVSTPFWGKFADKAGNIKVLSIVSRIIPAIPIAWLFCANIGYLAFVQVLSGICWGAFDLSTQSYLYKVAPKEKKLRYIVYTRCLLLLSTAVGGLGGAFLVKGVFATFGSQLLSVFMISGFFRALVVMYLIPKLVDLAVIYRQPKAPPPADPATLGKAIAARRGLFYRQPEPQPIVIKEMAVKKAVDNVLKGFDRTPKRHWAVDSRLARLQAAKKELAALMNKITPPQPVRVRAWAMASSPVAVMRGPEFPPPVKATRRPWYGDEEITAKYAHRNPPTLFTEKKAEPSHGLYRDHTAWSKYLKESLQAALREMEERKSGAKVQRAPAPTRVSAVNDRRPLFTRENLSRPVRVTARIR